MAIPFIDLQKQYRAHKEAIDRQIREVLDSSGYILGPKVEELEKKLAAFAGVKCAAGCGSGTDALQLALMAIGLEPGDEVITTPFTFIATAEIVALLGGAPVFVDIERDTYNIDPEKIEAAVTDRTRAIIPVDLFGQCAEYDRINQVAAQHGLTVIEDAAQSYGALYKKRRACSLSDIACASFFPAKPLGCYGDGGMVFTNSEETLDALRSLRVHGQGEDKYNNVRIGFNGRLDAIQAAVLLGKLPAFEWEIEQRQLIARRYSEALKNVAVIPAVRPHNLSVWAQYSIRVKDREALQAKLKAVGVPTAIYYPKPLHLQKAFEYLGHKPGDFPVTEEVAADIVSLPMHAYLDEKTQDFVIEETLKALKA